MLFLDDVHHTYTQQIQNINLIPEYIVLQISRCPTDYHLHKKCKLQIKQLHAHFHLAKTGTRIILFIYRTKP